MRCLNNFCIFEAKQPNRKEPQTISIGYKAFLEGYCALRMFYSFPDEVIGHYSILFFLGTRRYDFQRWRTLKSGG
jgi:hypothetical protein